MIVPHFILFQVLDLDTSARHSLCCGNRPSDVYCCSYLCTYQHPQMLHTRLWMGGIILSVIIHKLKVFDHIRIRTPIYISMTVHLNVWTWMRLRHQIENVLTYVFISSAVFLFINLLSFTPLWIVLLQLSMHGAVVFANLMTVNRTRKRKITGKCRRNITLKLNSHEQ